MQLNMLEVGLGGGAVWQYANRGHGQMMSYLLETPDGKTVMIDGGRLEAPDAQHIYDQIKKRGGKVDLWIITHAHDDHFGALLYLMRTVEEFDIEIGDIRFDFPSLEWLDKAEGGKWKPMVIEFYQLLEKYKIRSTRLIAGETVECGGLYIDIIRDASDHADYRIVNDTSVVLRVRYPKRDILFLADLGLRSASELASRCPEKLKCDIVQMAHHGHNAADKVFYEIVQPKIALYTSPDWLWNNDSGDGKGSGPWKTLITREWMEELGVLVSCPHAYGDYLLI